MGQESLIIEALKLGAVDFIVKPFKPERLLQTVKNILD
jgi:two-component system chemotaxis response regulator CheY